MNPIIASIMALLAPLSNAERALSMQNYMKNHFQFLGIASKNWRKPLRAFLKQSPLPTHNDLKTNTLQLFQLPKREFHYCGIEYLAYYKKLLLENDIANEKP